jgi:hypothetical protein
MCTSISIGVVPMPTGAYADETGARRGQMTANGPAYHVLDGAGLVVEDFAAQLRLARRDRTAVVTAPYTGGVAGAEHSALAYVPPMPRPASARRPGRRDACRGRATASQGAPRS